MLFPTQHKPIPKDLKDIETIQTTKSYARSHEYSKKINVECVGDWNKFVISSKETLESMSKNIAKLSIKNPEDLIYKELKVD